MISHQDPNNYSTQCASQSVSPEEGGEVGNLSEDVWRTGLINCRPPHNDDDVDNDNQDQIDYDYDDDDKDYTIIIFISKSPILHIHPKLLTCTNSSQGIGNAYLSWTNTTGAPQSMTAIFISLFGMSNLHSSYCMHTSHSHHHHHS